MLIIKFQKNRKMQNENKRKYEFNHPEIIIVKIGDV